MNETRVHTLEQVSHVLEGTQSLEFSRSADNRGRYALIETILQDFPDLTGHEVYVCGSVKMVDTAFPAFLAHELSEEFTNRKLTA